VTVRLSVDTSDTACRYVCIYVCVFIQHVCILCMYVCMYTLTNIWLWRVEDFN
jgi:hypothetical protein